LMESFTFNGFGESIVIIRLLATVKPCEVELVIMPPINSIVPVVKASPIVLEKGYPVSVAFAVNAAG